MREAVKKESVKDESVKNERLSKWFSQMGVCSWWEAGRLIQGGKVLMDGCLAIMGQEVSPGQVMVCNEIPVSRGTLGRLEPVLLAINKPWGIVCTTSSKDKAENIMEYLKYSERIYPVGRLGKESEGLLLVTNQGGLVSKIIHSNNVHEKEHIVTVDHAVIAEFMDQMAKGVYPKELDVGTRPCRFHKVGGKTFSIILTQRLSRQIRRMYEACGYHVKRLARVRIMNLCLGNLKTGESRRVTPEECRELTRLLKGSTSLPIRHGGQ